MTAFEEMGLLPEIAKAVEEMDWMLPTDIQQEAIPSILGGGDVLMAAETGSGKTGAFCLPVLQIVWEAKNEKTTKSKRREPQASWTLSLKDRSPNLVLANDRLSCQSKQNVWQGVRTNKGVKMGEKSNRFYFEVHFKDAGLCRVGWSLADASYDLGTDRNGWGFGGTGKKSNSRNFDSYGTTFGDKGDVIGNMIDLNSGEISWSKNGTNLGVGFKLDPQLAAITVFYPTICTKNAIASVKLGPIDESKSYIPEGSVWVSQSKPTQTFANPQDVNDADHSKSEKRVQGPKALIIEPSQELAEQTYKCLVSFKKYLPGQMQLLLVMGGTNVKDQVNLLKSGVDIVVATPGRLEDLVQNGYLVLEDIRFFILDEVDGLLLQGQADLINRLSAQIPNMSDDGNRLQMIVCSATLHNFDVKKLAERLMYFPTWIDLKGEDSVPETVHHVVVRIDPRKSQAWKSMKRPIATDSVHRQDRINHNQPNAETLSEAVKLLKGEMVVKAIDQLKMDKGIIFCRTKLDCDNLEHHLNSVGGGRNVVHAYSCVCLHADRRPPERKANLEAFKSGQCKFLICTDVAARGIDVIGVPFVIQVTLPDEKANYVHRIGRVGRAERMGLAISLVASVPEKVWYHSCPSRGKSCSDTRLKEEGGCCIWYNELQLLGDIEDHLNCTLQQVEDDLKIEMNEFDGKVTYGSKKTTAPGLLYETHVEQLAGDVIKLLQLERKAQSNFLKLYSLK